MNPFRRPHRASFRLVPLLAAFALSLPAAQDYSTPYDFTTLAGLSSVGSSDGPAAQARFYGPSGVALDGAGNLYVADQKNNTIRRITPAGVVSTLAGTPGLRGSADGTGADALFGNPQQLAADAAGNVYVTDKLNQTVRKITPTGAVTTLAGTAGQGGSTDGTGAAARFYILGGAAVDAAGNVYVTDWGNQTIRKITPAGVVTTLAGKAGVYGSVDGKGDAASFMFPMAVAVDAGGTLYVAELDGAIRKVAPDGTVTTLAGVSGAQGSTDGPGTAARFRSPTGIGVDRSGNVYVSDSLNQTIRKITPDGTVSTLAGTPGAAGSADGTGAAARFRSPQALVVDAAGTLFVAEDGNNTIRRISPAGVVTTVAGLGLDNSIGSADGAGASALFTRLASTAVAPSGDVYVADTSNSVVRKISPTGVVTTVAGKAGTPGSADGTGADARFANPFGLTVDAAGNVYVTDTGNDTIRRIGPGGVVTTVAGIPDGQPGSTDGSRAAARFHTPSGLAVDGTGNVYVADTGNHAIRRITPAGEVSTFAGSAGLAGSADGGAASARFMGPTGITIGPDGVIYVADTGNHLVRKIASDGRVSTLAGNPQLSPDTEGADGAGAAARFKFPNGIAVDGAGYVFVADSANNTIRRVSPAGDVVTLGGLVSAAGHLDGTGRTARFLAPPGIGIDATGAVYVSSGTTLRIGRRAGPPAITTQPASQTVAAGGTVQFSVAATGVPAPTYQWYLNGSPYAGATDSTLSFASARASDAGDYTVTATNSMGSVTSAKATLTVSAVTTPAPSPAAGGSGGGAMTAGFLLALVALAGARRTAGSR